MAQKSMIKSDAHVTKNSPKQIYVINNNLIKEIFIKNRIVSQVKF